MANPQSDRNLLFGIFALQMDFISRDALIKGMNAWVLEKTRPLGEILAEQCGLRGDIRHFVETMINKHLEVHDNDPHKSLAALGAAGAVRKDLEKIADADLANSLAHVSTPPQENEPATISYTAGTQNSVGTATSAGTRFRILRPHAKGGLGEVFVAQDEELNREVALKEIQERHADNPDSRARFLLEAEITGGLEHPGIVPVYGLGANADGRPFYAMRFIRGDSLKDAIERFHKGRELRGKGREQQDDAGRSIHFRKLLGRFLDICNAIQYAHDRGVLHRDLKPGNIMLGKYGETLVVDWGLAKAGVRGQESGVSGELEEATLCPRSAGGSAETVLGKALGTPQYMSPEQAEGRFDLLGPGSDVYSLGATLYCLLTGKAPFHDADRGRILEKVQKGEFPRPRQLKPDVSPPLEAVCLKAMARRSKDRYESPRTLADDIEHWLADEPVSAWPEPWTVATGRWMRRHKPLVSGAAAALLVALIGLTAGLLWYQDEQNRRAQKQALAEEAIRNALEQSEQSRRDLHAILQKPGGVFGLLNDPARWQSHIQTATASLDRALALLGNAGEGVNPELASRAAAQQALLRQDDADRLLAMRLEKIRMDKAVIVAGKFDLATAAREYPKAFAEAGFAVLKEPAATIAATFRAAPIKEQLVAAVDDWAVVAFQLGKRGLPEKLVEIGRRAAPDPAWGDRLRQIRVWQDQKPLAELAKKAPGAGLSPALLDLVGNLLVEPESWYRQAAAQYPTDFWLNFEFGNALRKANPVEASAFYRVAIAVRPGSIAAYTNLGIALADQKKLPEAVAAFHKAIDLNPKDAIAYCNLGIALRAQKKLPEAIAAYHKAIELDPKYANAYNSLGAALHAQKKLPEAVAAFHKAIELDPKDAIAYYNLGTALRDLKKLPEAIAAYHKAIELEPKYPTAYTKLGIVLADQNKLREAIAAYHKAIDLDPKDAMAYYSLGIALRKQKKLAEAIAAYHKAIECNPDHPEAHCNMGHVLKDQGDFAAALTALQKGHQLGTRGGNWPYPSAAWVKHCQELLALEKALYRVLKGGAASASQRLRLAEMCIRYKQHHATAARLYQEAFTLEPGLAEDWARQHRYDAACAAALAGLGQGDEAAKLQQEQRAKLRRQAHAWLQADLDRHAKHLQEGKPLAVLQSEQRLSQWQADADVAGVRGVKELAKLPQEESKLWQKLWADVAGLLKEARSRFIESRVERELTDKDKSKVHAWSMTAGRTYVIELQSADFDALLKLEDPQSKLLAENDDISKENLNSRLLFTAPRDGVYRIVATSFEQASRGAYVLIVREFATKSQ